MPYLFLLFLLSSSGAILITNQLLCQLSQGGKYGKLSSLCPFQANQLNKDASLQNACSAISCAGFENNGRMCSGAFQSELPDHLPPSPHTRFLPQCENARQNKAAGRKNCSRARFAFILLKNSGKIVNYNPADSPEYSSRDSSFSAGANAKQPRGGPNKELTLPDQKTDLFKCC